MLLTEQDIYHFREGTYFRAYERLGAHADPAGGATHFAVWAPNAEAVSVLGDFNGWNRGTHALEPRRDSSGIWQGSISGVGRGALYKYAITARHSGEMLEKCDPYGFCTEVPPRTASVVWDLAYQWNDTAWMSRRAPRMRSGHRGRSTKCTSAPGDACPGIRTARSATASLPLRSPTT